MKTETWIARLHETLPDWQVWRTSAGWCATPRNPAPVGVLAPPSQVGPFATPQQLREECQAWALHLPPIPQHIQTRNEFPVFCRWRDRWAVVGPAEALPEHGEVAVWQYTDGAGFHRRATVTLGLHVAART